MGMKWHLIVVRCSDLWMRDIQGTLSSKWWAVPGGISIEWSSGPQIASNSADPAVQRALVNASLLFVELPWLSLRHPLSASVPTL